jgi:hypothetical protein
MMRTMEGRSKMSDHTEENLTPVTDEELNDCIRRLDSGILNQYIVKRIARELRNRRYNEHEKPVTPTTAIELAQLSRELVTQSREMRAQEKKIVDGEHLRDMYKQSSEYMDGEFMRLLGVLVKITERKEDPIELARKALEFRGSSQ